MQTSLGVQTVMVTPELLGGAAANDVRAIMAQLVLGRN
jgi:hypothetical protein